MNRTKWEFIDLRKIQDPILRSTATRLNALGSLWWFAKAVLHYHRLTPTLHLYVCRQLETENLRKILELPRAVFKTTVGSISLPIWWALPFTVEDEDLMRSMDYGDEWIRWMYRAHDQNTRTLIVSETDENVEKIGQEIGNHYLANELFRHLWPAIIPDKTCTWNLQSMMQRRAGRFFREGTFDLGGVGKAFQSRHYNRIIEDDLFGEKALLSETRREQIIEYHKKMPGLFDNDPNHPGRMGDNLIIGNRWAVDDLNSWVLRNQKGSFTAETHSMEGGCCDMHPAGTILFPEEFTWEKLKAIKEQMGPRAYSAQYLNNPLDESVLYFRPDWIKEFAYHNIENPLSKRLLTRIRHEVKEGEVIPDISISQLDRFIIVDPAHSGAKAEKGRARHAVLTVGFLPGERSKFYILRSWAEQGPFENMVDEVFAAADKFRVDTLWVEVMAGQDGWELYFREKNSYRRSGSDIVKPLKVKPLKKDRSAGAKDHRIESLVPLFASGQVWFSSMDKGFEKLKDEYLGYPSFRTRDLMDCLGYAPQCVEAGMLPREDIRTILNRRENIIMGQMNGSGY